MYLLIIVIDTLCPSHAESHPAQMQLHAWFITPAWWTRLGLQVLQMTVLCLWDLRLEITFVRVWSQECAVKILHFIYPEWFKSFITSGVKKTLLCNKCCLSFIPFFDVNIVVFPPQVNFGKDWDFAEWFNQVSYSRDWIVVFDSNSIKGSIVHDRS